jgi:hypothetical protein
MARLPPGESRLRERSVQPLAARRARARVGLDLPERVRGEAGLREGEDRVYFEAPHAGGPGSDALPARSSGVEPGLDCAAFRLVDRRSRLVRS